MSPGMPPAALVIPGNSAIGINPAAPARGISLKLPPPFGEAPHRGLLTCISFITNYTPAAYKKFLTEAEWTFSPTRCRKSFLIPAPPPSSLETAVINQLVTVHHYIVYEMRGQEAFPREHHKAGSPQEEDNLDTFGNKDSA